MSLTVCIPDLIEQGLIPASRAKAVQRQYDNLVAEYRAKGMDLATAQSKATKRTVELMERDALRKRRNMLKQQKVQSEWLADMERLSGEDGPLDARHAREKFVRLDKKIDALRGRYFSTLDKLLGDHRRNLLGQVRNKDDLTKTGRELFGEKTGDLNAREMADSIEKVFEIARRRFNQAGGDIGKLDSYGLPQRHDWRAVSKAGFETWRAHPAIENVSIRDLDTGEYATGSKREKLLAQIFKTLDSDGADKADPGNMFMGAMANRRGDPRIMHFANFDDWISYQADFGGGPNIYDIISGHLSAMARDTAIMEAMGPNPAATLRFMKDWIEKSAKTKGTIRQKDTWQGKVNGLQRLYDELTGASKVPDSRPVALAFSALRSYQVASKLGSAVFSAVPDFATLLYTARFNNLPMMKTLGRYMNLWNPASAADRAMAVRMGLVTDDWINLSSSAARYTGDELSGEFSRRLAEFVIRSQGLARHTRNGQWAFGMEFVNMLTSAKDRSFANLDDALQKQMQRYGLTEAEWDSYRATPMRQERGTDWIFPTDNEDVGEKFLEMILSETDYAVLVPDLRTRSLINTVAKPGTIMGEIGKSAFLFKAFPIAIINLHGRRMMEHSRLPAKLAYAVPLAIAMIIGGALSAQMKTVQAGKDPMPMADPRFLGKAVLQSGALGLFGDLLYSSETSYGGGLVMTAMGPLASTVTNVGDATFGNLGRAAGVFDAPEDFSLGQEMAKDGLLALDRELPGRNLWYLRRAWERIITDSIREFTDPEAASAYERMVTRAEDEGTAYWMAPGEGWPAQRAPDWGNALAPAPE